MLRGGSWEFEIIAAHSVCVMTVTLAFKLSGLNYRHDGCLALLTYWSLWEFIVSQDFIFFCTNYFSASIFCVITFFLCLSSLVFVVSLLFPWPLDWLCLTLPRLSFSSFPTVRLSCLIPQWLIKRKSCSDAICAPSLDLCVCVCFLCVRQIASHKTETPRLMSQQSSHTFPKSAACSSSVQ